MARVLAKEDGGSDGTGYKRHAIYLPRIWFNAYEFSHGFEGSKGDLLVHFPGLFGERWEHMARWLDTVEGEAAAEWEVDLEQCGYENKTSAFWKVVTDIKAEITDLEGKKDGLADADGEGPVSQLKKVWWEEADDVDLMRKKLDELMGMRR